MCTAPSSVKQILIIFFLNLEIALRMIAGRADFGRFCPDDDMSAVAALPYFDLTLFKYRRGLYIFQQCTVSLLVVFLDCAHKPEFGREVREALLLCRFRFPPFSKTALRSVRSLLFLLPRQSRYTYSAPVIHPRMLPQDFFLSVFLHTLSFP